MRHNPGKFKKTRGPVVYPTLNHAVIPDEKKIML